jgi:GST-like protein
MPLTLFGSPGSGSAAVEMALLAAGQKYATVRASTWEPDLNRSQLLQVNPLGQIPTLVLDDGTVLTESAAILIHIGLAYPKAILLPTVSSARAQAIRGLVFVAANCYAAISVSDYPERWTAAKSKPAREIVRSAARAQLHSSWNVFADTFGAGDAMLKSTPGALEFLAVVVSQWAGTRQHLGSSRPAFLSTLLALEAHPRLAPILSKHREA